MSQPEHDSARSGRDAADSVETLFRKTARRFRAAGITTAELDARVLTCAASGFSLETLIGAPERRVGARQVARLEDFAARRLRGEPVSRILGVREFHGLAFSLNAATLDPRPDTETLVEAALEVAAERGSADAPLRILDLGTGSGCIIVSLLHALPHARGVACDLDPRAVAAARQNALTHGVAGRLQVYCGNWADALDTRFDLVVSNPPYVARNDLAALAPEVALFDPRLALDGAEDGLACYREIAPQLPGLLRPGAWALFEAGAGQAEAIGRIVAGALGDADHGALRYWRDLAGHVRCVGIRRRGSAA